MTDKTSNINLRHIPAELKREFRVVCIRENKSMNDKIIDLMRLYVATKGQIGE